MGIFKRISDIITANLTELVDGMEAPELMLKQAINEMEQSIAAAAQETARALAGQKRLEKELLRNQRESRTWQSHAERAVARGEDELARDALSRRREHDQLSAALEEQLRAGLQATRALRRQLDAMTARLSEAKCNLATLVARQRAAEIRKKTLVRTCNFTVGSDAFAEFERLREKVERTEAEADALDELRDPAFNSSTRMDTDMNQSQIESELAILKTRQSVQ